MASPVPILPVVLAASLLAAVGTARADAPAPSLALAEDPEPPHPAGALAVDPLGLAFGRYGVQLAVAPGPLHVLWLAPGWQQGGGPALEVAYHVAPLGRGVHGPFFGPVVGAVMGSPSRVETVRLGGEAGYRHVWSEVLVGVALGGQARWSGAQHMRPRAELRFRLALGWAWG